MTDLLPCPFCGKPTEYVCENDHHGDYFRLGCTDEDCPAHWTYYTEPQENSEECIRRWNTRAGIPAPAQPPCTCGAMDALGRAAPILEAAAAGRSVSMAAGDLMRDVRKILAAAPIVSLHGMIAAIYGDLDAEDRTWVDREWAKWRGLTIAAQPPAAPVEPVAWVNGDKLANLLDDRTEVISGKRDGWRNTPLYAQPFISDGAGENQPEQRTGPHRVSGETNSGATGDSELTRSARLPSDPNSSAETGGPTVIDFDDGEISVRLNGKELRGWSYSNADERRTKMLAAREYVEGWCDGRTNNG